jgi:hypothetical protein
MSPKEGWTDISKKIQVKIRKPLKYDMLNKFRSYTPTKRMTEDKKDNL